MSGEPNGGRRRKYWRIFLTLKCVSITFYRLRFPNGANLILVWPELTVEVEVTYWVKILQISQSIIITCRQHFRAYNFVGCVQVPCFCTLLCVCILLRVAAGTRLVGMIFTLLTEIDYILHYRRSQLLAFTLTKFVD